MALVILIVIVILIPRAYHFYFIKPQVAYRDTTVVKETGALQMDSDRQMESSKTDSGNIHGSLFYFDPNKIGVNDWIKLGLSVKQAAVIEKYKSKGGKFRSADDLRKIYVLSDEEKDRLVPYIKISSTSHHTDKKMVDKGFTIEVNTADSSAFEELYGIGPALSARIIKYRRLLGGFYSIEQVGETYGISDTVFQNIRHHLKVNAALVTKININDADYETLRKHPYIHATISHAIIGYRDKNGKFDSLDELKKLKPVNEEVYEKLVPYLMVK